MIPALVLAAAAAASAPDPQSIYMRAVLAWETRSVPEQVDWNLRLSYRGSDAPPRDVRMLLRTPAERCGCPAPDGSPLAFDQRTDPLRDPPSAYRISLGALEQIDGRTVYRLILAPADDAQEYRIRSLWVDTDDFEVRRIALAAPQGTSVYTYAQFGSQNQWWVSGVEGKWGSATSSGVTYVLPKTIASIRVSPLCSAVHTLVAPFLSMERDNHAIFGSMNQNVSRYFSAAQLAPDEGSPGLILARANLDWYSTQAYVNLARIDSLLKASYERTPQGKDTALDAIRERLQTLVDLERALTNQYASFAGARSTSFSYERSIAAEVSKIRDADGTPASTEPDQPGGAWIGSELRREQGALVQPLTRAVDYCGQ